MNRRGFLKIFGGGVAVATAATLLPKPIKVTPMPVVINNRHPISSPIAVMRAQGGWITQDGEGNLWAWGSASDGKLGQTATRVVPALVRHG